MRSIGHFIGGKEVKGTSGRTADVFEPMTGDVQAKVALASKAEVRAAVENARAAQPEWAATNPQRRARVMMKFVELVQRDYDKLAELLARERTGKTVPDAKGDIQRGLEVAEFACGIPHLMKGEYTEGAGPGIDIYSMRQPLGVVAGITPFNFPAMIPMWKFALAIACGNAFILKPSERDPGVPMMLAELMIEAGLPAGILNVVNGDKEAVDAILDDPDIKAHRLRRLHADRAIHLRARSPDRQALPVFWRRREPRHHHARRGHGPGGRRADRCRLRLGRRALHWPCPIAVPVGKSTADRLMEKLIPRVESPEDRHLDRSVGGLRSAGQRCEAVEKVKSYIDIGIKEGATLAVDGRGFKMQGYEKGFYLGGSLFDNVTKDMRIYKEEIFGARALGRARARLQGSAGAAVGSATTATASPSSPATATPRATSRQGQCRHGRRRTCRSRCRSPITPSAAGRSRASAISTSTARTRCASTPRPRR